MIVEPTAEEINLDDMKVRAPDLNLSCNEVHLHFFHDSRVVNGFEERDFDHHCDLLKFPVIKAILFQAANRQKI